MTQTTFIQSKKIERVSRVVSLLALCGTTLAGFMALISTIVTFCLLFGASINWIENSNITMHGAPIDLGQLNLQQQQLLCGALTLAMILVTACFFFLHRLFNAFQRSGAFSPQAITQGRTLARLFSITLLLMLLFDLFSPFSTNSETVKVMISNSYFESFILLGVIWIGVWVLEYGHDLLTENEMTI